MGKRNRRKSELNRKAARYWAGNPVTRDYASHIRSAERGIPLPVSKVVTIQAWKGVRRQGIDVFHSIRRYHPHDGWLLMFFTGNTWQFYSEKTECFSIYYEGKDRAERAFIRKITWVDSIPLPRPG